VEVEIGAGIKTGKDGIETIFPGAEMYAGGAESGSTGDATRGGPGAKIC